MKTGKRIVWSVVVAGLTSAAVFAVGFVSGVIERDGAFTIDRFDQHVAVTPDGSIRVVEDLDVTFHTSRRGIFRDLDAQPSFPSVGGFEGFYVDRGDPADPWHAAIETGPTGPRLRIGQSTVWLDPGTYRYRIGYTAPSWQYRLADDPDRAEIRIDSPGFDWPTSITSSSLFLEAPGPILDAQCVEGPRRTTRACETDPVVEGNRVVFTFRSFEDREAATVAAWVDADAFTDAAPLPTYSPDPLDESGGIGPWPLNRVQSVLVMLVLLALPLLAWEKLLSWAVYRDRVTDPALHDRQHPAALPAPPHGFRPPEVAGLLLRTDADQLFLSTLVDLDQRRLVATSSQTVEGGRFTSDKEILTVALAGDRGTAPRDDAELVDALLPGGVPVTFTGSYNSTVASRVDRVKQILRGRASSVFDAHGFKHNAGGLLARGGFRGLVVFLYLLFAVGLTILMALATPLHPVAGGIVVFLVLLGWAIIRTIWSHHRLPLNSEGRDATVQARAFEEFIRTVERDQLEWAADKEGIDHLHPALSLLPYAIALGLADSWYRRFDGVMREIALAAGAGAAAGGTAWWLHRQSFNSVSSTQQATTTAPSSSGGGGGGGGSGGGGGGGGSW